METPKNILKKNLTTLICITALAIKIRVISNTGRKWEFFLMLNLFKKIILKIKI